MKTTRHMSFGLLSILLVASLLISACAPVAQAPASQPVVQQAKRSFDLLAPHLYSSPAD
ncbi:MAG: hypothetical protein M9927_03875 [Anaerolineae bacterium]|nr:hypothetical protein [Anaerolineae bacterium]